MKIDDLLKQKEISKYITEKPKIISLIKSHLEFLKLSENNETFQYVLPEGMSVFSILNIPPKMKKDEVKKCLELVNLQYNRLYKSGFYWIMCTDDKETSICVQNSLKDLSFDDIKVKYDLKNKSQIFKMMKEQLDTALYRKEAKGLGVAGNNNNNHNKSNVNRKKSSEDNADAFSWRKGSGEGKISNDFSNISDGNRYYKGNNNNYYNKNKRNRFNSDNAGTKYPYQKEYNKNNNKLSKETSNNNYINNNKDIEIDMNNVKYPLIITYKYSIQDMKNYCQKLLDSNLLENKPNFNIVNEDLIGDKLKEIMAFDELIETMKKIKEEDKKTENVNTNLGITELKIPKMNPLSRMGGGKNYNKFDYIPGNAP